MALASGANARLTRAREPGFGQAPAAGAEWSLMPFYTADFGGEQTLLENPLIGLAASRDDGDAMHDAVAVGATLEVPLDTQCLGWWLSLLFGPPATAGDAGAGYTHTWKSGGLALPSDSLELGFPDLAQPQHHLMRGAMGASLDVASPPTGRPTCRVGVLGKSVARNGAPADPSPAAPAGFEQFKAFHGSVSRNGAALGKLTSAQFAFTNNLEGGRFIGSGENIEDVTAGASGLTGSLGVRLGDGVLFGDAESKAPVDIAMGWTIGAARSLEFRLSRVFLPRKRAAVQGKGGVQMSFDLRGAYDAGAGAALVAVLKNGVASYA